MKAVVVSQSGGPEVLTIENRPIPTVKEGWSLIKVAGFGINHSEIFTRNGQSPTVQFPRVLGIELVGEIFESTSPVLHVGQRVVSMMGEMGRAFDGSYEEYALVPNEQIYPIKTNFSWAEMAAIPETFYTAYGIFESLQLRPTDRVLIRGASSGVGLLLLKLVKQFSRDIHITGTTRSQSKITRLKGKGFDNVMVLSDSNKLIGNDSFDKIADLVGVSSMSDSFKHLNRFGILNITGQLGGQWTVKDFEPISDIPNDRYLTGFYSGIVCQERLQGLFDYLEQNHVNVSPEKIFRLEQIEQAHRLIEGNNNLGKVVILNKDFLDDQETSRVK